MVDRSYKDNLKKTIILGLTQPGKTIEQIRQERKHRMQFGVTWEGDDEQKKYRDLPTWHYKGEIDEFVIKQLNVPDEVVTERWPSREGDGGNVDVGPFYGNVAHVISELRKDDSITDWKHGSGIWRQTHSDLITEWEKEYGHDSKSDDGDQKLSTFEDEQLKLLKSSEIKTGCKEIADVLLIDEKKIIEIVTALASGRHVLLAGPIGSGKTHLAGLIPKIFWKEKGGYYAEDYTATSDWTTQEVIGGLFPKIGEKGQPTYGIQNGCVVDTVSRNWEDGVDGGKRIKSEKDDKKPPYHGTWLIIDEFNRADIDKAFGQLFTSLRTGRLKIPDMDKSFKDLKIPKDFRIIGTLNTADKHFLFDLSDALKSRFAYIELDIPELKQREVEIYYAMKEAINEIQLDRVVDKEKTPTYEQYIKLEEGQKIVRPIRTSEGMEVHNRIVQAYNTLYTVRIFKKLGTAILKSIYQNLLVGILMGGKSADSLDNALTANLIPQLEDLSLPFIEAIEAFHSDKLIDFIKTASKKRNREDYVKTIQIIAGYLHENRLDDITVDMLVDTFEDGQVDDEFMKKYKAIQDVYDGTKKEFAVALPQLQRALNELKESKIS